MRILPGGGALSFRESFLAWLVQVGSNTYTLKKNEDMEERCKRRLGGRGEEKEEEGEEEK